MELWDLRRPEGYLMRGDILDESQAVFIPVGFCSDGMYYVPVTSGHRFRCLCLNPEVSPSSRTM